MIFLFSLTAMAESSYSPYADQHYPMTVYWGDTHLHTNMSLDANGYGNKLLTPDDAYRFARGKEVSAHNGMKVRLQRPLDFLVVADHAENIGVMPHLEAGDLKLLKTEAGKRLYQVMLKYSLKTRDILTIDRYKSFEKAIDPFLGSGIFWKEFAGPNPLNHLGDETFRRSIWAEVGANAERYNEPGKFTAFIGYEWSSRGTDSRVFRNLHRVVVYREGPEKTNKVLPFTATDSRNPEDLWTYLERYQQETGGEVLAIPHNGNVSDGEMFALQDFEGQPLTRAYAETRSRWEPLYEVTQIKGDGEAHPILSPTDEFADFETWNSWAGQTYEGIKTEGWEKRKASEYARSALKLGLNQQAKLGINPFKFGLIGSTDVHTSLAAVEESNFWGKLSLFEPGKYRAMKNSSYAASGYAAVWATENTREALFSAMKRKETYATTGPRMTVRFFGGWDYKKDDALRPDLAKIGYTKGVPMGGDLANAPKDKSPSFLIHVAKDPDGANLDRVQVIKGWRSEDGELHEKIYNVALSDGRVEDEGGKAPPVGNTVDVADASYVNSIGEPELAVVWTDPDFNPNELAFYYVRVLEIPTPRWTAYDAKFFGLKNIPEEVPMITQERAYSSPIWYSP